MEFVELKKTMLELVENLIVRAQSIKDLLMQNEMGEGTSRLLSFFEDIVALTEGIMVIDPEQKIYQVSDLNQRLQNILGALELNDTFYISDLLEQELIPLLSDWKEKLA